MYVPFGLLIEAPQMRRYHNKLLVFELRCKELAIESSDVSDRD
jgi:hypothetical protein